MVKSTPSKREDPVRNIVKFFNEVKTSGEKMALILEQIDTMLREQLTSIKVLLDPYISVNPEQFESTGFMLFRAEQLNKMGERKRGKEVSGLSKSEKKEISRADRMNKNSVVVFRWKKLGENVKELYKKKIKYDIQYR